jgi:hypothetical protein
MKTERVNIPTSRPWMLIVIGFVSPYQSADLDLLEQFPFFHKGSLGAFFLFSQIEETQVQVHFIDFALTIRVEKGFNKGHIIERIAKQFG